MKHRWTRRGHRRAKALERASGPDFTFFAQRLDSRCVLSCEGYTATRRESTELQRGCLAFSDCCLKMGPEGLEFSVQVDGVEPSWNGLPILGFTRRRPVDSPDLYPRLGWCLGQSVLVGMDGQAFARDQATNFVLGFKSAPTEGVAKWNQDAAFRCPQLSVGDVLRCVYTLSGRIQYYLNSTVVIDFDVERVIDPASDYYAVVDVCFNACSLTVLPSPHLRGLEIVGSTASETVSDMPFARCTTIDSLPAMSDIATGDIGDITQHTSSDSEESPPESFGPDNALTEAETCDTGNPPSTSSAGDSAARCATDHHASSSLREVRFDPEIQPSREDDGLPANPARENAFCRSAPCDTGFPLSTFQIHIEKGCGGLGLKLEVEDGTGLLLITAVTDLEDGTDGPISAWNKAHPEAEVRAGDCVFGVNGTSGKAADIVKVMKAATVMNLTIRRGAVPRNAGAVAPESSEEATGSGVFHHEVGLSGAAICSAALVVGAVCIGLWRAKRSVRA